MGDFGSQLAAWRLAKGLTQIQLADAARMSRPNLSAIEASKRDLTLKTLIALARALNIKLSQLLEEQPPLPFAELDRFQVDAVARAIVSGERTLGEKLDRFTDEVASLITQKLQAFGVKGFHRIDHLKWDNWQRQHVIVARYGRELVHRVLDRVGKHLPHAA